MAEEHQATILVVEDDPGVIRLQQLRLERAGLSITPRIYWLASVVCGVGLAALVTFSLEASATRMFLTVVVGLVGVFGVPRWFVNKLTARRQARFLKELPNAIDIVVRGMKSGLPLNECLAIIARESEEPLAGEFREVTPRIVRETNYADTE